MVDLGLSIHKTTKLNSSPNFPSIIWTIILIFSLSLGIPVNNTFVPGMGPILLDDVTCVPNYSELFQCVHPLDIGIHNCNRENVAGVICPNITTTLVLLSVTSIM